MTSPDALILLVGVAGSGKSTLAARCFASDEVLSSDAYRAALSGDAADQSVSGAAFTRLHAELASRMAAGLRTVVDATNVQPWARNQLAAVARRHGRPVAAVVLDLPLETCLARNAGRAGRQVPPSAVRSQHRALRRSLPRMGAEGYAGLLAVTSPNQADALEVVSEADADFRTQRNVPKERHPAL